MQYLGRFEMPAGEVCQGIVQFPAAPRGRVYFPDRWFRTVADLAAAHTAVEGSQLSLRTSLRGGQLSQTLLFHAPAPVESQFRHYLASFLELLALVDDSVALPLDRATHDQFASVWAPRLYRLQPPTLMAGGSWLACPFRILDFLPQLLAEAAAVGIDLLHQVNFQTWDLPVEHVRASRRNLVALEQMRGLSPDLHALQHRLL